MIVKELGRRFGQTERYLEVIESVYGYKSFLPFSQIGDRLVSSAFFEYGGLVGIPKAAVRKYCRSLLKKSGARYIEVHGGSSLEENIFRKQPLHQTALKILPSSQKILWESVSYEAQKMITQSEKADVKCRFADHDEIKEVFFPMYCRWMKSFGSPNHPLDYFELLAKKFKKDFRLVVTERNGKALSFLLGIRYGKVINLLSSPAIDESRRWRANDAAHWFLLKWAVKNKLKWFDFGPVRYEGQRRFKVKWGVELHPYAYWYYSLDTDFKTPEYRDPDTPFYRLLRWGWRYLLPDKLASKLGPVVRKKLGI